jgi:hypothetical protein
VISVVQTTLRCSLMLAIGSTPLLLAAQAATGLAAVPLAAVTTPTEIEHLAAALADANPRTQRFFEVPGHLPG